MTKFKKKQAKALAVANNPPVKLHPALERLVERLSSPRLKAPGTISSYLITGANFLKTLKGNKAPTDSDFRQYFIRRRGEGVGEGTLRKEFFHLQKLTRANKWDWPFDSDDTPYEEEKQKFPVMRLETVEQLIKAQDRMSKTERFYLAVATTWLVRRVELTRIKRADFDGETFIIHTAKHGKKAKHLIPDVLQEIFSDYHPQEHSVSALSLMFKRLCAKAGVQLRPKEGWHSIRYALNTFLERACTRAVLADFSHWKSITNPSSNEPTRTRGQDMIDHYRRSEILEDDPYYADKIVYSRHPFLPFWQKKR